MSNPPQESKDIFTVCKQNVAKFFGEIEKSTPRYQQSVAKLQHDYIEAWKNVINSAITLEQEYATKSGLNTDVPQETMRTINEITNQAINAYVAQNKIALDAADASRQAFNSFNENTKSFASLNRTMMDAMVSAFEKKTKT